MKGESNVKYTSLRFRALLLSVVLLGFVTVHAAGQTAGTLYGTKLVGSSVALVSLDPATGTETPVTTIATGAYVPEPGSSTLGNKHYFFYLDDLTSNTARLYSVNLAVNPVAVSPIGPALVDTPHQLRFDKASGNLYGVSSTQLLRINPTTGEITPVVSVGNGPADSIETDSSALGNHHFYLYLLDGQTGQDQLLSIAFDQNPIVVSPIGAPTSDIPHGMQFDDVSGQLYGYHVHDVVTIDLVTGLLTPIAAVAVGDLASFEPSESAFGNHHFYVFVVDEGTGLDQLYAVDTTANPATVTAIGTPTEDYVQHIQFAADVRIRHGDADTTYYPDQFMTPMVIQVRWNAPFDVTEDYTAVCSPERGASGILGGHFNILTRLPDSVLVEISDPQSTSQDGPVDARIHCIAVPDSAGIPYARSTGTIQPTCTGRLDQPSCASIRVPMSRSLVGTATIACTPEGSDMGGSFAIESIAGDHIMVRIGDPHGTAITINCIAPDDSQQTRDVLAQNPDLIIARGDVTGALSGQVAWPTPFSSTNYTPVCTPELLDGWLGMHFDLTNVATDSVSYENTDGDASLVMHCLGVADTTVAPPGLAFSSTLLTFAPQPVGIASVPQTVSVSNPGNSAIAISSISIGGNNLTNFLQVNDCGASVAPGASCTISVTLKPKAPVPLSALVWVVSGSGTQGIALSGSGIAPQAVLSSTSLTFAPQLVGTSSTAQTVTLSNPGNAALPISSISIGGNNVTNFLQGNDCGASVAPGASCTISVTLKPKAPVALSAQVWVIDSVGTQKVSLTGSGVAPQAVLSKTSLTFAPQSVGTTSAAQTVTLSNPGNAALPISSISIGGTNLTNFAQTNDCGASVAASASCTISVTLKPKAPVALSAQVWVIDSLGTQKVSLSGSGVVPQAQLSTASLTFAPQLVGTTSTAQTVTLSNPGNGALAISSITIGGNNVTNFLQVNDCGANLAAGASCTISVTLKPKAPVALSAQVWVIDSLGTQKVSLSGSGVAPQAQLSTASLTFAPQLVGTTSAAQTVTLSNPSNAALAISSISMGGTNNTNFAQTNDCGSSLAAGASCTISVTMRPKAAVPLSAQVVIADWLGTQRVNLSGSGQ